MSKTVFFLHTYTPAEAEQVTGVSVTMQRDWRRHGHIPASESGGHTRYDIVHLSNLAVMKALAGHVPLKEAKEIAYWAKNRVIKEALGQSAAWENYHESMDLDWMARSFIHEHVKDGRVLPGKMLMIFADGSEHFDESVDLAFARLSPFDEKTKGATVVIDLQRLGVQLIVALGLASPLSPIAAHSSDKE